MSLNYCRFFPVKWEASHITSLTSCRIMRSSRLATSTVLQGQLLLTSFRYPTGNNDIKYPHAYVSHNTFYRILPTGECTCAHSFGCPNDLQHSLLASLMTMQRGKVPILVGGTGFYLRWYVHGRPQTPASTEASIKRVKQRLMQVCLLQLNGSYAPGLGVLTSHRSVSPI